MLMGAQTAEKIRLVVRFLYSRHAKKREEEKR